MARSERQLTAQRRSLDQPVHLDAALAGNRGQPGQGVRYRTGQPRVADPTRADARVKFS